MWECAATGDSLAIFDAFSPAETLESCLDLINSLFIRVTDDHLKAGHSAQLIGARMQASASCSSTAEAGRLLEGLGRCITGEAPEDVPRADRLSHAGLLMAAAAMVRAVGTFIAHLLGVSEDRLIRDSRERWTYEVAAMSKRLRPPRT